MCNFISDRKYWKFFKSLNFHIVFLLPLHNELFLPHIMSLYVCTVLYPLQWRRTWAWCPFWPWQSSNPYLQSGCPWTCALRRFLSTFLCMRLLRKWLSNCRVQNCDIVIDITCFRKQSHCFYLSNSFFQRTPFCLTTSSYLLPGLNFSCLNKNTGTQFRIWWITIYGQQYYYIFIESKFDNFTNC